MRILACTAFIALAGCASSMHDHSQPYAGQQDRGIKALSADEVAGYVSGAGMGFAKAAELNGYPGPMHSLENADALGLTAAQREAIDKLVRAHKDEVRRLGEEVVRLERELDALFASHAATPELVEAKVQQIGAAQARVRASHLKAHLQTTALLTADQIARYESLRGYRNK
jgi:Spy/CpxP family protein refolding chaperone